jgi:hypothetical protein
MKKYILTALLLLTAFTAVAAIKVSVDAPASMPIDM